MHQYVVIGHDVYSGSCYTRLAGTPVEKLESGSVHACYTMQCCADSWRYMESRCTDTEVLAVAILHVQIYVDTDDDLRLSRRILRDIEQRGRDLKGVISQYTRFVKPAQDKFVTPSRRVADVIIPWHECVPFWDPPHVGIAATGFFCNCNSGRLSAEIT